MNKLRHLCSLLLIIVIQGLVMPVCFGQSVEEENLQFDVDAPTKPFPHKWENMFGSGRAILSLRESYRNDLKTVKTVADVKYVRFHNIFHDEVGVYAED